ncbi:transporter [Tenacibaculum sp. nBUS_03]|uniref:transporter n=1 Tax=Tenacibaculum sp. nBUS_03 TaxID=3395320 RepID=UPI003EB774AA
MKIQHTFIFIFISFQTLFGQEEKASHHHSSKPSYHAPIGVMGDHTHDKREWMFSYRFMYMNMENLKNGSNDTSFSTALNNYMVSPTKMPMYGHMFGLMYAPSNKLTLSLMFKYVTNEMDHITRMGRNFTTESSGFGDVKITGLYRLIHNNKSKLHTELGIVLPTGSISSKATTPASTPNKMILPYPMQIGSGTWDLALGMTYLYEFTNLTVGAQGRSLIRTGTNENKYRLGNKYELTVWSSFDISSWLSVSARLEGISISKIKGANPTLTPQMVTTADTKNTGGEYFNSGIGLNILFPEQIMKGLRMGLEFKHPLYQNLNGLQLKTKESFTIGIQYSI